MAATINYMMPYCVYSYTCVKLAFYILNEMNWTVSGPFSNSYDYIMLWNFLSIKDMDRCYKQAQAEN